GALLIANNLSTVQITQLNTNGTFTVNSGAYLTQSNGTASTVNVTATAASPVVLPGETVFFANSNTQTNFSGPLAGGGSLVLAGNNVIFLGNAVTNTYTGGTVVNAGTVLTQGSGNFGPGAITLNGGSFNPNAAQQTFSNAVTLSGAVAFAGGQNTVLT